MKIAKMIFVAVLALAVTTVALSSAVEAANRKGSHRIGGYNSHGKGSHYVGGYKRHR